MGSKILVAFDESPNALRAVEFVAQAMDKDSIVTLLSIGLDTAALCDMNSPELTPYFKAQQSSFCTLEDKKRELVQTALEGAQNMLIEAGFAEDRIRPKIEPKKDSVAQDILREARDGYDLIVIGRHGTTGIKDFFLGSISQKVFNAAKDISVMVVT